MSLEIEDLIIAAALPPLNGTEAEAERLVLIVHRCVDWDVWGGSRALRYWSALTDRIKTSCYAGPMLADWWARIIEQMSLSTVRSQDAATLASILGSRRDHEVLRALRTHADALVLRVRVVVETKRAAYAAVNQPETEALGL